MHSTTDRGAPTWPGDAPTHGSPATTSPSLFESTLARFVALATLLLWIVLAAGAPFMVRAIRADGGTPTEYLFFGLYGLVLTTGLAGVTLLGSAITRRIAGPSAAKGFALALTTLIGLALVTDALTFALLGLHPYGRLTWAAVATEDVRRVPWWSVAAGVAVVVGAGALTATLWRVADRSARRSTAPRFAARLPKRLLVYFPTGLVTFLALDQPDAERVVPRAALPFYALWLAPGKSLPDARPAYSSTTAPPSVAFERRPTIVFLMADSFRWDVVSPEVMPFLSRLAVSGGCASAPRHYASGHLTQFGTFSLLYGLEGYAFLPFMQEGRLSTPLAALDGASYRLEGYDASGVSGYSVPPLRRSQFDRYESIGEDSVVVARVIASLRAKDDTPRFVFGFLSATHAGYSYPPGWSRFPTGSEHPPLSARERIFNRYRNSAGYVDSLVARVYRVLAPRIASGEAALVVTGDHGEEFWEHGLNGHAAVRFHDERTRVPLVACFSGAARMKPTLSTHADVFPTLFDWMGAAGWDSTRVTGRSLLDSRRDDVVSLSGAGFPTQAGAFAIVTPTHKFWLHLDGPDLGAMVLDRATDSADVEVPMSAATRREFERARVAYLRKQRAVIRVDGIATGHDAP